MAALERPFRHQPQHFSLPGREARQRIVVPAAGEQLRDDVGVEHGAALAHPAQRIDELIDVGHPVLQQVADAAGLAGQQLAGVTLLDVLREDHHRDRRPLAADDERRAQPLIGERGRHPHVHHHDVGLMLGDGTQGRLAIGDGGHDIEVAPRRAAG